MSENFVFNALYGLLILTVVSFFVTILFDLLKIRVNPKLWKTITHDEWLFIAGKRRGSMWTWIKVEKIWWIFYIERGEQFRDDYRAFWHFKEASNLLFMGLFWTSFGLIVVSLWDFRFIFGAVVCVAFFTLCARSYEQ